jgi:hypothetical protein
MRDGTGKKKKEGAEFFHVPECHILTIFFLAQQKANFFRFLWQGTGSELIEREYARKAAKFLRSLIDST